MSSRRLAFAAALAVFVSASPGAEPRECAELGRCAVAADGGAAADHLLFQARAKMHKTDTSAAEDGGEIHKSHKSHKSAYECQIKEKRGNDPRRRGGFLSDGYGIEGFVGPGECTAENCNFDKLYELAADMFVPEHEETHGGQGLCACMRKGCVSCRVPLIKFETRGAFSGGYQKENCNAGQCWHNYATAVYATEVKNWVNTWEKTRIRNFAEKGWVVGCVASTEEGLPSKENLLTVEDMLDEVDGEHGITRGSKWVRDGLSVGDRKLKRRFVEDEMKELIPGLEIEKKPKMAPPEPEVQPEESPEEPEPEAMVPQKLCDRMGEVVSKLEQCSQMIGQEMTHVSEEEMHPTGHAQFLGSAMEVLEASLEDESHDVAFQEVIKKLRELEKTSMLSDMDKFLDFWNKAFRDMTKLRGHVETVSLETVRTDLLTVMQDVMKATHVMSQAKRALECS